MFKFLGQIFKPKPKVETCHLLLKDSLYVAEIIEHQKGVARIPGVVRAKGIEFQIDSYGDVWINSATNYYRATNSYPVSRHQISFMTLEVESGKLESVMQEVRNLGVVRYIAYGPGTFRVWGTRNSYGQKAKIRKYQERDQKATIAESGSSSQNPKLTWPRSL